ncbi:hypothetical protein [Rhizobium oryziradicis]|uniref:Uncharacterized protein n=1 Tax=Rhizobium oryziradicis TaxID=1867956 RepID=A0A1Q8ZXH5_9HYPH|nr:hypothetical protein [Rhizobium oryziradicis]OLP46768.1 hypothetical protein BJF95_15760 [Rhizobium oryziradicis]
MPDPLSMLVPMPVHDFRAIKPEMLTRLNAKLLTGRLAVILTRVRLRDSMLDLLTDTQPALAKKIDPYGPNPNRSHVY